MKIKEAQEVMELMLDEAGLGGGRDVPELMAFGLGKERLLDTQQSLNEGELQTLHDLVRRRIDREPLQYIIGEWDFYGETFSVGEGVLIPRSDTETLVEKCIKDNSDKTDITVIDLCAGSGCIGLTLEKNLSAKCVIEVEKSAAAFEYLKENKEKHNSDAKLILGDIFDEEIIKALPQADVITCNPPYLSKADFMPGTLQPELEFEPFEALYGGEDGLDFYARIARAYKPLLKKDGIIYLEIGFSQEQEVMKAFIQNGYTNVRKHRDLGGVYRVITADISEQYA